MEVYNKCHDSGSGCSSSVGPWVFWRVSAAPRKAMHQATARRINLSRSVSPGFTPNSSTRISSAPSGLRFSSPRNIIPSPRAPRPMVKNSSISGEGYLYNLERVLCHRSCSVRWGKSDERIEPICHNLRQQRFRGAADQVAHRMSGHWIQDDWPQRIGVHLRVVWVGIAERAFVEDVAERRHRVFHQASVIWAPKCSYSTTPNCQE